jgi:hypothetical protein
MKKSNVAAQERADTTDVQADNLNSRNRITNKSERTDRRVTQRGIGGVNDAAP